MFKVVSKEFVLSLSVFSIVLGILLLPTLTLAAEDYSLTAITPTAYLERSQIIGTGKQINVYRVPTMDSTGKVEYYDLTIKFVVTSEGKFKTPTLGSSLSPDVFSDEFVPGTYFSESSDGYGSATCTVTVGVLKGGRMEVALACKSSQYSHSFSGSAVSGPIAGHPYQLDLLAAGIDKISGNGNSSWGKVGYNFNGASLPWWGCLNTGDVISARQAGNTIVLSGYDNGNIQKCGVSLVIQK
jgi:hypothetical protein